MKLTFVELMPLMPVLIVSLTAVLVMLSIAIKRNHFVAGTISVIGLNLALLMIVIPFYFKYAAVYHLSFFGMDANAMVAGLPPFISGWFNQLEVTRLFIFDGFANFYAVMILVGGLACCTLAYPYINTYKNNREELYILMLVAVAGAMLLAASVHMASFFISLELLSVSTVGMLAYTHERSKSLEAGIKYLVLSAAASATILMGMAFLYAYVGTMQFTAIGIAITDALHHPLAVIGTSMIVIGMATKLSFVPFHAWTPDVYQGAPSPVSTFLASVSKVAALAVVLRFLLVSSALEMDALRTVLGVIAVVSIVVGNLLAVSQVNLKRLLGYSSIAHMGYILIALICVRESAQWVIAIYVATYLLTTLGAFGVVALMSSPYDGDEAESMADYRGLFWRRPLLTAVLTVMMLSLAGIPLTAGFMGKFQIIQVVVDTRHWVFLGAIILGSVIGLYYYLRVLILLYMTPPDTPRIDAQAHWGVQAGGVMILLISLAVLVLGIYPEPLIKYAQTALIAIL